MDERPAYGARLEFTIPMLNLLGADEPLPATVGDLYYETRMMTEAIGYVDRILDDGDSRYDADQCDEILHILGWELHRVSRSRPRFDLPVYTEMIPSFGGVAGDTLCDVTIKIASQRWAWLHKPMPMISMPDGPVAKFSSESLGEWEFARQLARCATAELPWIRANWDFPRLNTDELKQLLSVEARRSNVRADTQSFSEAVKAVRCGLTQSLIFAQWHGLQNGKTIPAVNDDFRTTYRKKLGKTDVERKKKFDTISRRAREVMKPFKGDT